MFLFVCPPQDFLNIFMFISQNGLTVKLTSAVFTVVCESSLLSLSIYLTSRQLPLVIGGGCKTPLDTSQKSTLYYIWSFKIPEPIL